MKNFNRMTLVIMVLLSLFMVTACQPRYNTNSDAQLVLGDTYRLKSGERLNRDLVILGGSTILEDTSVVGGNVAMIGGSLEANGEIDGDVALVGGNVQLNNTAVIKGDIVKVGGNVDQKSGARIEGKTIQSDIHALPVLPSSANNNFRNYMPDIKPGFNPFSIGFGLLRDLMGWLALALLAVLITLFAPRATMRVGSSLSDNLPQAAIFGLLTLIIAPALLVILCVTIILIPVALLGVIVLGAAVLYGWIAVGLAAGQRLADAFHTRWTDPLAAGIGTLVITAASGLANAIPCVGWIVGFIITILALGAVVVTRFGLQNQSPQSPREPVFDQPTPIPPADPFPGSSGVQVAVQEPVVTPSVSSEIASTGEVSSTETASNETPDLPSLG